MLTVVLNRKKIKLIEQKLALDAMMMQSQKTKRDMFENQFFIIIKEMPFMECKHCRFVINAFVVYINCVDSLLFLIRWEAQSNILSLKFCKPLRYKKINCFD